jgi:hypothetical protein
MSDRPKEFEIDRVEMRLAGRHANMAGRLPLPKKRTPEEIGVEMAGTIILSLVSPSEPSPTMGPYFVAESHNQQHAAFWHQLATTIMKSPGDEPLVHFDENGNPLPPPNVYGEFFVEFDGSKGILERSPRPIQEITKGSGEVEHDAGTYYALHKLPDIIPDAFNPADLA